MTLPENVVLETIKPAENGDGRIIRIYERFGKNAVLEIPAIAETDMLERKKESVDLALAPYKIKTFLLK